MFSPIQPPVAATIPFRLYQLTANDPIIFKVRASAQQVVIGEELELTISAEWSFVPPSMLFTFEGANEYTLQLVLPKGFVQTGGTFYPFTKGKVDAHNPKQEYTVKGFFEAYDSNLPPSFMLIRGDKDATEHSIFIKKTEMQMMVPSSSTFHSKKNSLTNSDNSNELEGEFSEMNSTMEENFIGDKSFFISTSCPQRGSSTKFKLSLSNPRQTPVTLYVYTCYKSCNRITEHIIVIPAKKDSLVEITENLELNGNTIHTHVHLQAVPPTIYQGICNLMSSTDVNQVHNDLNITNLYKSLNFAISATSTSISSGQSSSLSASSCNGTFKWSDTQTSESPRSVSPTSTTTYTAVCTDGTCTYSKSVTITVTGCNNTPPAPTVATNKTQLLFGELATLSASNCSGTIEWFGPNNTTYGGSSIEVGTAGNYYAKCTNDCNKVSGASSTLTLQIVPLYITSSHEAAFYNEAITLTAYGCNGVVQWQDAQGTIRSVVNNTNANFTGPGTYKARCMDQYGATSDWVTKTITVKTAPTPRATADRTEATLAETVNLSATGCEPYFYNWVINEQSKFGATQTATGPGEYRVRCWYADNTPAGPFVTVPVSLKALGAPTITASQPSASAIEIVYLTSSGCDGDNVGTRWIMNVNGTTTYKWGTIIAVNGPGTYYANCTSGNQVGPQAVKVILPKPAGAVSVVASQTSACSGEPVSFKAEGCTNGVTTWRKDLSVYLSDLNPVSQQGTLKKDVSVDNRPITIGGKVYQRGLGVHASSYLKYNLNSQYRTFRVTVGRDDESDGCCGTSTVRFKILVNGIEKYNKVKGKDDIGESLEIDVTQKTTLELYVLPEDQDWGDHADWANARLEPLSGGEEVKTGKMVDFYGPGTYEAYCVTAGISSPASTVSVLSCNATAPQIETSKTRVRPLETFTLSVKGSPSFTRVIQGNSTKYYWSSNLPATITGPAKIEAGWSGGTVKKEVFEAPNNGLQLIATKYKVQATEQAFIFAIGCDYGRVEWKIGTLAPSYGFMKTVTGPGYYEARCVPQAGAKPDLFTNSDWVLLVIKPTSNIEPLVTAPARMCMGVATSLSATGCPTGYGYQWKTLEKGWNNFGASASISQPQEIEVRCLKSDGSFWYPSKKIQILPAFPADFKATNNGPVLTGSSLRLAATYVDGATYRWTGPNGYTSGTPVVHQVRPTA